MVCLLTLLSSGFSKSPEACHVTWMHNKPHKRLGEDKNEAVGSEPLLMGEMLS